jgi:hypothetical protein
MASLIQINNNIKTLAMQHAMIKTVFFGVPTDRQALSDVAYPLFAFDVQDMPLEVAQSTSGKETITYKFWFIDAMKADKSNEEDALSDMVAISNDIIALLKDNDNDFQISSPITRRRISDDTPDQVCGVEMDVNIFQPYTSNRCQIPTI